MADLFLCYFANKIHQLYKFITILYISCFALYILFSREPDFFDGDFAKATITQTHENGQTKKYALFYEGSQKFNATISYPSLFTKGEQVEIIYEKSNMANATVYSFWGYWITIEELFGSIILWVLLFMVAVTINKNPLTEGLQLEENQSEFQKRKYDD